MIQHADMKCLECEFQDDGEWTAEDDTARGKNEIFRTMTRCRKSLSPSARRILVGGTSMDRRRSFGEEAGARQTKPRLK